MNQSPFNPSSINITMGGPETTDEIVASLKNCGWNVEDLINQRNFPLTTKEIQEKATITIYDPGVRVCVYTGGCMLEREGLLLPAYEHALRFAQQYERVELAGKRVLLFSRTYPGSPAPLLIAA